MRHHQLVLSAVCFIVILAGGAYLVRNASNPLSEWTVVRETNLEARSVQLLSGATQQRETLLERGNAQLLVTEHRIIAPSMLEAALRAPSVRAHRVGSRDGYVVPVAGITPGSAFVIVGATTIVTIEYGDRAYGNLQTWPEQVSSEVERAVNAIRVP